MIITTVHHDQLLELGRNLCLDEYKLQGIFQYHHEERHQRLIELWFEQECDEPCDDVYTLSREKLVEALPRRESMDYSEPMSASSVVVTPPCGKT